MALSAIGEGCHQQMEGILNEIVNFVLLFLQDPVSIILLIISKCFHFCCHDYANYLSEILFQHPRVRYAACNAIGQMATDFAPGFQKKFHEKASSKVIIIKRSGKPMPLSETFASEDKHFFFSGDSSSFANHGGSRQPTCSSPCSCSINKLHWRLSQVTAYSIFG